MQYLMKERSKDFERIERNQLNNNTIGCSSRVFQYLLYNFTSGRIFCVLTALLVNFLSLKRASQMVGKSKDNKAGKGKKALESEWNEAVAAAAAGAPLIASATNKPKGGKGGSESSGGGIYVAQTAGGSAKQRLKQFEEALAKSSSETADPSGGKIESKPASSVEMDEARLKEEKKLKKKAEKDAKEAFERKAEEERQKRRQEKEKKEVEDRLALLELGEGGES